MTSPRTTQGGRPPFRRGGRRRRQCYCKESVVDYKDASGIRRFITDRGRIEPGKKSGNCAKCQRNLTNAIKRARHLALLPFAPDHLRVTGAVATGAKISDEKEPSDETSESTESVETINSTEETEVKEEAPVAEAEPELEVEADDVEEEASETPEAEVEVEEASEEPGAEETEAPADDVSTDDRSEVDDAPDAEVGTDEEDK